MNASRRFLLFLFLLTAPRLHAQLSVTASVERTNYVSSEPVQITVTVTNTSGNDVVLGGPNNTSWMNFVVTADNGRQVTAIDSPNADAVICRAGQSLQKRFNLPRYFHLVDSGTYIVRASAYFADLQRWVSSRPVRITINQAARPRWEQTIALPPGHKLAGKYRRYQLINFHDTDRSYLYVRIIDESTGMFIATYRLSSLEPGREVQPAIDRKQNLHVLCLGSPMVWAHQSVDPDGTVLTQKFYRQGEGVPQLITQSSGEVMVMGGRIYDPMEKPAAPAGTDVIRRLSDRPAGVPLR